MPVAFDPDDRDAPTKETIHPEPTRCTTTEPTIGDPPPEYFVLGGNHLGTAIARRLQAEGHAVALVDETHVPDDVPGLCGDPTDVEVLETARVEEASTVVVATSRDSRNLLVAQHLRSQFEVSEVIVLVHTPDRCETLADTGHEPVCVTSVLSNALLGPISTETREFDRTV